jgi:hypothetical protein
MNELDNRLLELATAAQQTNCPSKERSQLVEELIRLVVRSRRLCRPHQARFPYRYDEIYEEACQNLFLFLYQNTHQYKPEKASVLGWLNFLLRQRFMFEASRKIIGKFPNQSGEIQLPSPDSETVFLAELTRRCLEEDEDQSFQQAHIEHHPEANFRAIALWKLDDQDWNSISNEMSIPVPTLSSFYQRQINKFKLKIQAYVQDNSQLSRRDLDL